MIARLNDLSGEYGFDAEFASDLLHPATAAEATREFEALAGGRK